MIPKNYVGGVGSSEIRRAGTLTAREVATDSREVCVCIGRIGDTLDQLEKSLDQLTMRLRPIIRATPCVDSETKEGEPDGSCELATNLMGIDSRIRHQLVCVSQLVGQIQI
jgi:hypothetical protein